MSGLYARYVTNSDGSDGVRVATFGELSIVEAGNFPSDKPVPVLPGVPLEKVAKVMYTGGEIAVYIFLEVEVSDNWTVINDASTNDKYTLLDGEVSLLDWGINSKWTYLTMEDVNIGAEKVGMKYVYYQELAPNVKLDDSTAEPNTAEIVRNAGEINIATITKENIGKFKNTYINFTAHAVQLGGFADAEEAWESVQGK